MKFLVIATSFDTTLRWLESRLNVRHVNLSKRLITDEAGNTYEVCNLPQQLYGKTFDAVFTSTDYQSIETLGKILTRK